MKPSTLPNGFCSLRAVKETGRDILVPCSYSITWLPYEQSRVDLVPCLTSFILEVCYQVFFLRLAPILAVVLL